MVKIQVELSDGENRLVDLFKAERSLETKELAIKEIIKETKKCKHHYVLEDKLNFLKKIGPQFRESEKPAIKFVQRCDRCGDLKEDTIFTKE